MKKSCKIFLVIPFLLCSPAQAQQGNAGLIQEWLKSLPGSKFLIYGQRALSDSPFGPDVGKPFVVFTYGRGQDDGHKEESWWVYKSTQYPLLQNGVHSDNLFTDVFHAVNAEPKVGEFFVYGQPEISSEPVIVGRELERDRLYLEFKVGNGHVRIPISRISFPGALRKATEILVNASGNQAEEQTRFLEPIQLELQGKSAALTMDPFGQIQSKFFSFLAFEFLRSMLAHLMLKDLGVEFEERAVELFKEMLQAMDPARAEKFAPANVEFKLADFRADYPFPDVKTFPFKTFVEVMNGVHSLAARVMNKANFSTLTNLHLLPRLADHPDAIVQDLKLLKDSSMLNNKFIIMAQNLLQGLQTLMRFYVEATFVKILQDNAEGRFPNFMYDISLFLTPDQKGIFQYMFEMSKQQAERKVELSHRIWRYPSLR